MKSSRTNFALGGLVVVLLIGLSALIYWQREALFPSPLPKAVIEDHYLSKIQPVFNARCIACHSCYNSPCQLDLTSYEGVSRGASHVDVYDFPLLESKEPTRVGIDAHSVAGWRQKGFFTVLNPEKTGPSILVEMIRPAERPRQKAYEAESSRICIDSAEPAQLKSYFAANPGGAMPFGLPALQKEEFQLIADWVRDGAKGPSDQALAALRKPANESGSEILSAWEDDLNKQDFKSRLTARYIYEHLFAAHISIEKLDGEFYRLVRAKNKKGEPVEIATVRPYDDPGAKFYYRLKKFTNQIVAKTHLPYELSEARKKRWQELFFKTEWLKGSDQFPTYGPAGANAFETFKRIPAESRYRFLLDDAYFHVANFIKGPVCRGQTALNVINDHFWVMFVDPKFDRVVQDQELYRKMAPSMSPPAKSEDEIKLFKNYREGYWQALHEKYASYRKAKTPFGVDAIWDGDRKNSSALLTVYRHFDSAQVLKGAWGEEPPTVWVMDYQVFEDIYYNLVAGYNVYGPLIHQLNTRLYMEISRISSEDMFLNYLPQKSRVPLRRSWYRETKSKDESLAKTVLDVLGDDVKELSNRKYPYLGTELNSNFKPSSKNAKSDFLKELFEKRFTDEVKGTRDFINQSIDQEKTLVERLKPQGEDAKIFKQVAAEKAKFTQFLPDVVFIRIRTGANDGRAYTLVHNKSHLNVSLLLFEDERRDPANDTINLIPGFAAAYPNLYVDIPEEKLAEMVNSLKNIKSAKGFESWRVKYAKSRHADDFWALHDWFNEKYAEMEKVDSGYLDLNRYGNF